MSVTELARPPSPQSHSQSEPALPQHLKPVTPPPVSKLKLGYDILMLVAIVVDLLLISIDIILMSSLVTHVAEYLNMADGLHYYQNHFHQPLRTAGEFFTVFLIVELIIRWIIAIRKHHYYRWFFFPFVHWYEVLGCLPQFRALRLLRAFVIGRFLYKLGYQVLPQSWLDTAKFYYEVVLEELSDRVLLTAINNIRQQLADKQKAKTFLKDTFERNQADIEAAIAAVLKQALLPYLQPQQNATNSPAVAELLASEVGIAIQDGLANTPELRRYLKLIPIAGSLIEGQLLQIGQHVGENVVLALNQRLLDAQTLDKVVQQVAQGIVQIDPASPQLEALISSIITDVLDGFEAQIKVQQWKHSQHLKI